MTQSYFEEMGRKSLAPIDTSEAAALPLVADMTKSQADITERQIQNLTAEFDRAGREYAENYKDYASGKQFQSLIGLVKQGKIVKNQFENIQETRKRIDKFYANIGKDRKAYVNADLYQELTGLDPDVKAQNDVDFKNSILYRDLEDENAKDPLYLLNPGLVQDNSEDKTALEVRRHFPLFIERMSTGNISLLVGHDKNGRPIFLNHSNAVGPNEVRDWFDEVTNIYAHHYRDIIGSPGKWKRDFLADILRQRDIHITEAVKALSDASREEGLNQALQALSNTMEKGGGYNAGIEWVETYRGLFNGSYALAKKKFGETIAAMASKGYINEGEAEKLRKTVFKAHDGTPQTIEKYWPNVNKAILNGVRTYQTAQANEYTENAKARNEYLAYQIVSKRDQQDEPVTIDQIQADNQEYATKSGQLDPRLWPETLKNRKYVGIADDVMLDAQLDFLKNNGGVISLNDIAEFANPDFKSKWRKHIANTGGKPDSRKTYLDTVVNEHFDNKLGRPLDTEDYLHTMRAAQKAYNREYDKVLKDTGDHELASQEAELAVNKLLAQDRAGEIDLTRRVLKPYSNPLTDYAETLAAFSKDPTIINSDKPMPGEEGHIDAAIQYLSGQRVAFPHYYTKLASAVSKTGPQELIRNRMRSLGILKENEMRIPEENLLSIMERRRGRFSSPATTYQIAQENTNSAELFKTVADEYAISDKGAKYDHIRDLNGEVVELEKPLSQHTVGEVVDLIFKGYTDFGLYGIPNRHLLDLFESLGPSIDYQELFDEDHQNALVLAMLRRKSAIAQRYCSLDDSYRHLVTFDSLTRQEFNQVVGELPPYLQPENMLPACSKELVEQLLQ